MNDSNRRNDMMKGFEDTPGTVTFIGTAEDLYWLISSCAEYKTDPYDATGRSDLFDEMETAKSIFKQLKEGASDEEPR